MPEPLLYLKSLGAAAIVSGSSVLVLIFLARKSSRQSDGTSWPAVATVIAIGLGSIAGYQVLALHLAWPPASALDRWLTIVLPAVIGIEMIAAFESLPRSIAWMSRAGLAVATPRILLHDSVYLGDDSGGTPWLAVLAIAIGGALLAVLWNLLAWLSRRSQGVSISFALCMAISCAAMTVMMAGYIKGGAVAIPLVAALLTTTIAAAMIIPRCDTSSQSIAMSTMGIGLIGLFGVLFIGRFFGSITTEVSLTVLLAPLLCWVTEMPKIRARPRWLVGTIRLTLVAIPLLVVLVLAKREFDRDMAPLLGNATEMTDPARH